MLGFSIVMRFVSAILIFVSISLLREITLLFMVKYLILLITKKDMQKN